MAQDYVRICPVCEIENPPERARCVCGASLAGVDFSLRKSFADARVAGPTEDLAPALAGNAPTAAETPANVGAHAEKFGAADGTTQPPNAATRSCPYADCGQPNPPDATRCIYCNRLLHAASSTTSTRPLPAALRERYAIVDAFP